MQSIWSVAVGAIITAIVGNALVQRWQLRSWYAQQRQIGYEKELSELKALLDELSKGCDARLSAMRQLTYALYPGSSLSITDEVVAYRVVVKNWNSALSSYYTRLALYVRRSMAYRLEREIHKEFVIAGRALEILVRGQLESRVPSSRSTVAVVEDRLNEVQAAIISFSDDLLAAVIDRRSEISVGRRVYYLSGNIAEYSTFELVKALFVSDVKSLYVVRPA